MKENIKKIMIVSVTFFILALFYAFTKFIPPDSLNQIGLNLPLPLFTFLIALVDGFNPCNLFVITLLLSLILTGTHSRAKIFAVGFSFIAVVYMFYFLFMAAWLNIFKYVGFIDPLRITIGSIAIIAGLINCKELFFYRKWITLMVQDRHVGILRKKIVNVMKLMRGGSIYTVIGASIVLAVFSSLVELPCTAGFPIIYTGILTGHFLESGFVYYLYLAFYNADYVLPLVSVILVLGFTLKRKRMSKQTMGYIKFIGGAIMLLLGFILLGNPSLLLG